MRLSLFDLLAPHSCCSCGEIGRIFCDYCKYDIVNDPVVRCLSCLQPVATYGAVCGHCTTHYTQGWAVGLHRDALRHAIADYKFRSTRAAGGELAGLLSETLPIFPTDITVVPIPTVRSHIRERGFDHAALLARRFAILRGLHYSPLLMRRHAHRQRGASRAQRAAQAASAFRCAQPLGGGRYVLVDDVCTTGATVNQAARTLREAGADEVWVAVISREPLD